MANADSDPTVGVDFGALKQTARDHLWIPFTQYNDLVESNGPMVIVEGDGVRVKDSDGKSYIDGIGGLFLVNVGHGRKEIAEAVAGQLNDIHYASTFSYGNIPEIKLAQKMSEITPGDLSRVFFASGGSEAVDTALKIARQYHVNKGESQRTKIISRRHSYHGVSLGALSVNSSAFVQRNIWEPMLAPVSMVGPTADEVEELIEFEGPDTFAAFITEPVSITKGVVVPPDGYWPRLREICDKHGVLLIADEVINGFGRTGKMFAMEHWGVIPDMMTFAKGVTSGYQPVGGVVARPKVYDAFIGDHGKTFTHGYTYSGHPAGAAAALVNIDIMERENLVE
ncbi:MAG: aspartate aminotransferase family protein, partial [Dehalococcoidia bacterium]